MRRSKRRINSFINHLFGVYNVPRIPVYIHWYYDSIIVGDEACFGVFQSDDNGKCCLVGWNYKTRIPNITEGRAKWYMAYYSYELAEAAFEQIKNYYHENGGFKTIKEVEL